MENKKRNVVAPLNFIKRLDLYDLEKPFSIGHEIESWTGNGREASFTFEKNGFAVIETASSLEYHEFEDKKTVEDTYVPEIGSCLLEYFGATSVHVFSVLTRRRHPKFPQVEMRKTGPIIQPATRVHVDGTAKAFDTLLTELDESRPHANKRFIYVNVWKPLNGPLYDWPLAICDAATVEDQDLEAHDQVLPEVVRENYMVRHNAKHRWYYLSGQTTSELLVFRQVDSDGNKGVPHTSFPLPHDQVQSISCPRESIELRAVVYLD
ncbi:hypothetical protein PG996_009248 [Apiospora saccharicola]|uniref:Methyltransferase n=1 Tax=Apiospora saccharicola TaxID=335842 RepID=A0ABR1UK92_9PEZI